MATPFVTLALKGANPLIDNYDTIYDKSKEKLQKVPFLRKKSNRNLQQDNYYDQQMDNFDSPRRSQTDPRYYESRQTTYTYRDRDAYGRPRDASVEEISRDFPPPGQRAPRARSVGRDDNYAAGARGRRNDYRPRGGGYDSSSDSEAPVPARPRNLRRASSMDTQNHYQQSRGAPSTVATRENKKKESSSEDSHHSDDVLSSSEDERQSKKYRHKAMLTAGLAAVATIQAASGVYASMEARDKRYDQVKNGTLSPEEARKEKNKARLQDAAAIGIAALGIKGAYGKWQATNAHRKGYAEHKKAKKERHQKRLEKAKSRQGSPDGRPKSGNGGDRGYESEDEYNRDRYRNRDNGRYGDGNRDRSLTRYQDGNPYAGYNGR